MGVWGQHVQVDYTKVVVLGETTRTGKKKEGMRGSLLTKTSNPNTVNAISTLNIKSII
jgi:hypothetical protein